MADSVIVTLANQKGRELIDVELPCNVVIADYKNQLRHIPELSLADRNYYLEVNGKRLDENTSLSDNNVWDGSILVIGTEGSSWHF